MSGTLQVSESACEAVCSELAASVRVPDLSSLGGSCISAAPRLEKPEGAPHDAAAGLIALKLIPIFAHKHQAEQKEVSEKRRCARTSIHSARVSTRREQRLD